MSEDSKNDAVAEYSAEWWAQQLETVEKEMDDKFRDSGDKIVKRYLDERDGDGILGEMQNGARKYNVFWANTQILQSALYATPPKPVVKRQHDDAKDDVARTAALIFQRMLSLGLDGSDSDMHNAFQSSVEDRLLPGMGQVWLRLENQMEPVELPPIMGPGEPIGMDPMTGEPIPGPEVEVEPAFKGERIVDQKVVTDYVHWRDFFWSPARTWGEVWWVGRRIWMKKKAFIKQFGEEKFKEVKENSKLMKTEHGYPKGFEKGRLEVFELWCEDTNKVYFIHKGTKTELAAPKDDPLQLDGFWPTPKPLLATHTTNSLYPRADYVMVQDQYEELDTLNDRINTLTKALRVVGAYDKDNAALQKMITGSEFAMIPVDKWAVLSEAGGMAKAVDWFPVEMVANVLDKLVIQRQLIVQQIYELTSISDIMRGGSNPRETLGAQKLKAQYSSVRLRLTQQSVALFVCEAMHIKCEIISKHFEPDQIAKQSLIDMTESAMFANDAIDLLKDWNASKWRIEISEESLSMADYTAEREMRIQYLTAVGQFLSQSAQMAMSMPGATPYILKIIMWVTASFRGSDDIETVLDDAAKAAVNMPPPNQQKEQKPEKDPMKEAQAKAQGQIAIDNNQTKNRIIEIKAEGAKDIMTEPPPEPKPQGE